MTPLPPAVEARFQECTAWARSWLDDKGEPLLADLAPRLLALRGRGVRVVQLVTGPPAKMPDLSRAAMATYKALARLAVSRAEQQAEQEREAREQLLMGVLVFELEGGQGWNMVLNGPADLAAELGAVGELLGLVVGELRGALVVGMLAVEGA